MGLAKRVVEGAQVALEQDSVRPRARVARALARAEVQVREQVPGLAGWGREPELVVAATAVAVQEAAARVPGEQARAEAQAQEGAAALEVVALAAEAEPQVPVPVPGLERVSGLAQAQGWARVRAQDLERESAQGPERAQQPPSPPALVPPRAAGRAHPPPGCPGLAIAACF